MTTFPIRTNANTALNISHVYVFLKTNLNCRYFSSRSRAVYLCDICRPSGALLRALSSFFPCHWTLKHKTAACNFISQCETMIWYKRYGEEIKVKWFSCDTISAARIKAITARSKLSSSWMMKFGEVGKKEKNSSVKNNGEGLF